MDMERVSIIAEAGVNHNGSEKLAFDLVDAAYEAGVNIVKFQTFKAKNLAASSANQSAYQQKNTGVKESQLSMLSRLELSYDSHIKLKSHCKDLGIDFLSTAFDFESLDFLVNFLDLKILKIPSGEITNAPLVLAHARTNSNLIVSTGMATLSEIESILGVIAFGYISEKNSKPSMAAFQEAYSSNEGRAAIREKVTLLHCTTEYPAPLADINLRAIDTMSAAFQLNVGYSDHSEGLLVPLAAVARGVKLIEKHFTLDKTMAGPDHKASLNPIELSNMVSSIRNLEKVLGDGIKTPMLSEVKNKEIARKSIFAIQNIEEGEELTEYNIAIKRPATGMSPYSYWSLLDKVASRNYEEGDPIFE